MVAQATDEGKKGIGEQGLRIIKDRNVQSWIWGQGGVEEDGAKDGF